jgi:hypothetical protein
VTENLADRVDQIDFLVPAGELCSDLAGLFFRAHDGTDDLGDLDGALLSASHLEPRIRN